MQEESWDSKVNKTRRGLEYHAAAAAAAKSLQSCPTLGDPIDGSPPGSPIPGILQARTLGWVAISFSNTWSEKWEVKVKSLSRVRLLATLWTAAYQAPPSMGFSRQEYWSGVPLPSPECHTKEFEIVTVMRNHWRFQKGEWHDQIYVSHQMWLYCREWSSKAHTWRWAGQSREANCNDLGDSCQGFRLGY